MEKEIEIRHTYKDEDIEVIIEIPPINKKRDEDKINEIKKIMNNELLSQLKLNK